MEEVGEELSAFAEDTAQNPGDGEDILAVGHVMADAAGDPCAGTTNAPLVTGGAEVAALAGEGEQFLMAAVRAVESGEACGEIAAAQEGFDGGDGAGPQRAERLAVLLLVVCEKFSPPVVDDLPEG